MSRRKLAEDRAARSFVSRVVDRALETGDIQGLQMLLGNDADDLALIVKAFASKARGERLAALAHKAAKLDDWHTANDRKLDAERALVNLGLKPLDAEDIVNNIQRNAVVS